MNDHDRAEQLAAHESVTDALARILEHTGQAGAAVDALRGRPIAVATPADELRLELAEEWDYLRAVIEARFLVIRSMVELAALEADDPGRWLGL